MAKTTRKARVSGYGDYIAVDLIDPSTQEIVSTPFSLPKGGSARVWVYDEEEEAWVQAVATFDGHKVTASDQELLSPYELTVDELEDPAYIRFKSPVKL